MWLGPIQDSAFAERVLKGIENDQDKYGTWARMRGMLTVAGQVGLSTRSPLPDHYEAFQRQRGSDRNSPPRLFRSA